MKTLQMKTIRTSIISYIQKDMGLYKGHGLIQNSRSLSRYTIEQILLKTREHSLSRTMEKVSILYHNLAQIIA
ncbi:MAG: hypothetical protein DCO96_03435 [Fluviicola sp. XM-24bin1]|nr:MAG: hypothetical protein DCO96_03435 [Fluviicola sp. XM-24bin1]